MLAIALTSFAFAQDYEVVHTSFRTSTTTLNPGVLVGFNPQPDPPGDWTFRVGSTTATALMAYSGSEDFALLLGANESRQGVRGIWVEAGRTWTKVYGSGAATSWLPPGPCFDLRFQFGDGSYMYMTVNITSSGGYVDPGSLVGFNPQPEPPGDFPATVELDLSAYARGSAWLMVDVSLEANGAALPLY